MRGKEQKVYIDSSEISIVIQGPLYRTPKSKNHIGIRESLSMLRKAFPNSEIIISTWEGEDLTGIEVDKVVQSKDPMGFPDINRSTRNFNRQIVSTKNGIIHATRPYILKTRADILFTSAEFAHITAQKENSFLECPITMTNMVFRNHLKIPFLFHPSDVVHFGLKEDILDLWNIPLEEFSDIATNGKKNILFRYSSTCFKYQPEQSLCIRWLKKHGVEIKLKTPSQINQRYLKVWEETLANNFHIVNHEQSGIKFPPHFYNSAYGTGSLLKSEEVTSMANKNLKGTTYQKVRYLWLWFNKYVLCFCKKSYVLSFIANILYVLCPSLNQSVFALYRRIRPR